MLKTTRFRVQNFTNIDDSDWIPLERVTAFVGRNESGKTALLKALHKFNPATPEPYNPQREFPRDRYTRDFKNGSDWPVCSVAFELGDSLRNEIEQLLDSGTPPTEPICTRYYDGSLENSFEPAISRRSAKIRRVIAIHKLPTWLRSYRRRLIRFWPTLRRFLLLIKLSNSSRSDCPCLFTLRITGCWTALFISLASWKI